MSNESRDYAVNARIDNLTKKEAQELEDTIVKSKREIAPEGRGTTITGKSNKLSGSEPKQITD